MEKECRRCFKSKPLSEYYQHKQMFDGYLNVCKECTKKRVEVHREKNINKIREYDRNRPNKKERVEKTKQRRDWLRTNDKQKYQDQIIAPKKKWDENNPEKKRAQTILNNAVRDKRIDKPTCCSVCEKETRLHGHHNDYSKPLDVEWMCAVCHKAFHRDLDDS